MELREGFKLILGAALLVVSQTLNLFGLFRSVDWLRINAPNTFSFLSRPGFQEAVLIAGFGMCAWGLYETLGRKKDRHAHPSDSPGALPSGHSRQTDDVRRNAIAAWRAMVTDIQNQMQGSDNASAVTALLEAHPTFPAIRPYLSENTTKALWGRHFFAGPSDSTMAGSLHLVLADIEKKELEWAVGPGLPAQKTFSAHVQGNEAPVNQGPTLPTTRTTVSGGDELPAEDLRLTVAFEPSRMIAYLFNDTLDPVAGCSLKLTNFQEFSPRHNDFSRGHFRNTLTLIQAEILSRRPSEGCHLLRFLNADKMVLLVCDQGRASGATRIELKTEGIWRFEFLIEAKGRTRKEDYFFSWKPGEDPVLIPDPRKAPSGAARVPPSPPQTGGPTNITSGPQSAAIAVSGNTGTTNVAGRDVIHHNHYPQAIQPVAPAIKAEAPKRTIAANIPILSCKGPGSIGLAHWDNNTAYVVAVENSQMRSETNAEVSATAEYHHALGSSFKADCTWLFRDSSKQPPIAQDAAQIGMGEAQSLVLAIRSGESYYTFGRITPLSFGFQLKRKLELGEWIIKVVAKAERCEPMVAFIYFGIRKPRWPPKTGHRWSSENRPTR